MEHKIEKVKAMHTSNFIFWILGKFLLGLGIGILLPVYMYNTGWAVAGVMLIVFAIIIQIPAIIAVLHKKEAAVQKKGKM
ncbi:MAG: hypothetical protein GTN76_09305 [Candidatus Aenigmarchaeota archaeon]|nr:hypothetical protein [Candidatus Aenigmarchaeota archaeon]